ncbi:hypothetical protein GCM10007424_08820 [Flavobacterium suaedae]|uniref:Tetratricopeptide repeat protein n=1 Tax=Flavobacterium suaedae TaxID=1767027 RepID=A0ABQ1JNZ0_9FLAO|nr:tetratricopeptide repeat protein [Flavobacterium suaedae]GGB71058.1 hypothetical protein GCM10007424_08820 [Flavobacterium suaedae]
MNTKDYITLLNKPYSLSERQTAELEQVLAEFPYLQSARAIQLKGLYNQDSFRYNTELKKTAAHTTDRSVLFDFITSEQFASIDKEHFDNTQKTIELLPVNESEEITVAPKDKVEESIKRTIKESESEVEIESPQEIPQASPQAETTEKEVESTEKSAEEKLEIGKPLTFNRSETHSFSEWLQLSKITPINREENKEEEVDESEKTDSTSTSSSALDKKLEIIDRFIESNPKITPSKTAPAPTTNLGSRNEDNNSLMTETLAKVYLEQKKYSKAIQAYEILILKYPEKSVFFADRIADIKILQQNNN